MPRRRGRPRGAAGWPGRTPASAARACTASRRSRAPSPRWRRAPPTRFVLGRLARWSGQVEGRGACHHPDGVVRFLRSALAVFVARLRGPPAPRPLRRLRARAACSFPASGGRGMKPRLTVDPIACSGHGACAELFPERIGLDDWGYPIVDGAPVPDELLAHARRAVAACPTLALRLAKEREAA